MLRYRLGTVNAFHLGLKPGFAIIATIRLMAQSQIICDASAIGKTRIIRTKS